MSEPTLCCRALGGYCERCDVLVGLEGLHVIGVDRDDGGRLVVTVESEPTLLGCPSCGVVAHGHGMAEGISHAEVGSLEVSLLRPVRAGADKDVGRAGGEGGRLGSL